MQNHGARQTAAKREHRTSRLHEYIKEYDRCYRSVQQGAERQPSTSGERRRARRWYETSREVRVSPQWLTLREPADAAARSRALVEEALPLLPTTGTITVHDLGCGTGSMARWLAGQLPGPQHWVMYDRDPRLLGLAGADPPARTLDGTAVSVETRRRDITRLDPQELTGATLVTASALLDIVTAAEHERLLELCVQASCPVLITLSVTGRVDLTPADPLDRELADAFNAHQRRTTDAGRLLGPDAVDATVDGFARRGYDVVVRPSTWSLGAGQRALASEWLAGWLSAACEQRPELEETAPSYALRRGAEAADGRLAVAVHHVDLLAAPR